MRWGIVGTGGIADAFASTIAAMDGHSVVAVSSGDADRAAAFAAKHSVDQARWPHAALATATGIDAAYIATTNDRHLEDALACIAAGIPVLCEKPLTLDAPSAERLFEASRAADVFLMEAMWTRFIPSIRRALELVAEGTIGEVRMVVADFGFPATLEPGGRLLNPRLGGGALLDIGIYPLTIIHLFAGAPDDFEATGVLSDSGVDLQIAVSARHGEALSSATASFLADSTLEAVVSGTHGRIRLHSPFHHAERLTVETRGGIVETIDLPLNGSGYRFEVEEVERCVSAGLVESPLRPHSDTLAVLRWMDAIRDRIGVHYEGLPEA